ncbi:hypothetical protein T02_14398 [Trichinella nativa]|uniref:Uncharacterized protein n=1 Tax=Trichinella nativa TaxID=6335 RepID=A0A0V1LEX8_9BILA|nr:hypothetical protein T02_14398 [Trichinella nativa]
MVILEEIWRMSNCAGSCSNHTCGWDIQIVRRFNKTAFSLCKFVAFVDTTRGSKKIVQNKLVTGSNCTRHGERVGPSHLPHGNNNRA